ncbi:hypothetical protein D9619_009580 [Psilocybe cf. subviscida]|uniref:Uncharacterized protein n=1 Tax=Psilocybe cf. subviscida TaxID=2480587 RepID=A0A8H5BLA7_9AGAR|nr:hypothetical protein D9619_009580 [Psilocybe cf. subviscida]
MAPTGGVNDDVADSRCRKVDVERYRAEIRERSKQVVRCIYDNKERRTRDRETRTASGCTMTPEIVPEFAVVEGVEGGSAAVEEGSVETGIVALGNINVVKPDGVCVDDADGDDDGDGETEGDEEAGADADGVADDAAADEEEADADLDAVPDFRVELAPTVMVNIVVLGVEDAVVSISEAGTGMGTVAAGSGVSNEPDMPTSLKLADHAVYGAVPLSFFSDADAIATKYLSESGPAAALGMNVMDLLAVTSTGGMACTSFYFVSSASLPRQQLRAYLLPSIQTDSRPANCS